VYSIDASALIDGWSRYYPQDVMPTLWDRVDGLIEDGRLFATDEVFTEIKRGDDGLVGWSKKRKSMFIAPDKAVEEGVRKIVNRFPAFIPQRSPDGAWADPFVIALAQARGAIVVTGEKLVDPKAKALRIRSNWSTACPR
jgi:hypothetical protein